MDILKNKFKSLKVGKLESCRYRSQPSNFPTFQLSNFPTFQLSNSYQLKATTLPEALVAMVIVLLSFGIAVTIFTNVTGSSGIHEKTRADILLKEILVKTKSEKDFLDGEAEHGGITIRRKVAPYAGAGGVSVLTLTATDRSSKAIAEIKELVFSE